MIYLDACALLKFIKPAKETEPLRSWREALDADTELVTSELARLEITRTLNRARVDHKLVPYLAGQALKGIYLVDLSTTVLARASAYRMQRLGSLDAIHLATADPFRDELTEFVTYDAELAAAAEDLDLPVSAPS